MRSKMQTENGFVPCLHEIQNAKKQSFADGHTSVVTSATHLTKEKGFGKHEGFLLFILVNAGDPGLTNCRCATGQRFNVDRFPLPDNVCSN